MVERTDHGTLVEFNFLINTAAWWAILPKY
jgi:hypothetical protein